MSVMTAGTALIPVLQLEKCGRESELFPSIKQSACWAGWDTTLPQRRKRSETQTGISENWGSFLSDLLLFFTLGNFNCRNKHEFFFVQSFQNVLPLFGGKWSIVIHMPMAMKYSSQNQSSLFFPLDYDQVARKARTQKHREYPYCSFEE